MHSLLYFLCFSFLPLMIIANAHAGVYKWTDAEGNVHFSDKPPAAHLEAQEFAIKEQAPAEQNASPGMREDEWRLLEHFERKRERAIKARQARAAKHDSEHHQREKVAQQQQKKCESYRQREEKVSWKLRTGYGPGEGSKLRRQQRDYADKISRYCQ